MARQKTFIPAGRKKFLFAMKTAKQKAQVRQELCFREMNTYKFLMIVVYSDDCVLELDPRRELMSCTV